MTRWRRFAMLIFVDTILVNLAFIGAYIIRFEGFPKDVWFPHFSLIIMATGIRLLSNYFFGLYRRLWRYASINEVMAIVGAVTVATFFNTSLTFFGYNIIIPRSIIFLTWALNIFLLGGSRLGWRILWHRKKLYTPSESEKQILIVGAGDGGVLTARELKGHYGSQVRLVGFVDDDPIKQNQRILGFPVLGTTDDIPTIVRESKVDEIIISMPSVPRKVIRKIVVMAQQTGKIVKILPGVYDLIDGNVTVQKIREVELEDLLGRDPVESDLGAASAYMKGQVVLVTGAGGSIGSELCRQILEFEPSILVLVDNCENNMYDIEMELGKPTSTKLVPLVKDAKDRSSVEEIFDKYRPQVVFHAAAYKHVPLMEENPEEAIKNNVYGTHQVAWASHKYGAKKFVLVSTDKAVNPTSVMGATKRIAEMIVQYLDTLSETDFVAVRFGNVLGSKGSVIPLFRKQILAGGPVTVTDMKMIRYFMTIPEAVQLILQAGALAKGGEIFVLDMGEPVKIYDLAVTLIRLSGFQPYTDIDIKITGMRPGEKLYEELLTAEEGINSTSHKRIFVAKPINLDLDLLDETVAKFNHDSFSFLPQDKKSAIGFIQGYLEDFVVVTNDQDSFSEVAVAVGRQ